MSASLNGYKIEHTVYFESFNDECVIVEENQDTYQN